MPYKMNFSHCTAEELSTIKQVGEDLIRLKQLLPKTWTLHIRRYVKSIIDEQKAANQQKAA